MEAKEYRVTWRHEVHFLADNDEHAKYIWEAIDLNDLQGALESPEFPLTHADFVERVSFECVSDGYRDVRNV